MSHRPTRHSAKARIERFAWVEVRAGIQGKGENVSAFVKDDVPGVVEATHDQRLVWLQAISHSANPRKRLEQSVKARGGRIFLLSESFGRRDEAAA